MEGRLVGFLPCFKAEEASGIVYCGVEAKVLSFINATPVAQVVDVGIFCVGGHGFDVEPSAVAFVGNHHPFLSGEGGIGRSHVVRSHLVIAVGREVTGFHGEGSAVSSCLQQELSAGRATGEIECLIGVTVVQSVGSKVNLVVVRVGIIVRPNGATILRNNVLSSVHVDDIFHRRGFVGGQRDGESHVVKTAVELRLGCGECRFLCFHFIIGGVGFTKDGDGSADGSFQVLKVFEGEVRVGNIVRLHHGVALNVGFVAAVLEGGGVVNGSFQRLVSLHNSFGSQQGVILCLQFSLCGIELCHGLGKILSRGRRLDGVVSGENFIIHHRSQVVIGDGGRSFPLKSKLSHAEPVVTVGFTIV